MKHKVFLNKEGLIETTYSGDVKYGDVDGLLKSLYELAFRLEDKGEKIKLLVDLTRMGNVEFKEIKNMAALGLKSLKFEKLAVFGGRPEILVLARTLLMLAGKSKLIKSFKTREEAEEWLGVKKVSA